MTDDAVTPRDVAAAARLADLALPDDRLAAVASLLSAWIPNANALSRRMQASNLDSLVPSVVFLQTGIDSEENVQ
ncbi:hypothetical protein SAMN05216207_10658 [Pseudonocardia ammonioxydans]|uniref:Uncharacterized protein n=1 Tax=Pseudonocardia ammonioxydans TaxID=260086 RepID=A0A1I5HGR7_PSUAM|nr:hypothetical protein [Pseudonocardia ammonioxydans]SFO47538.1 hypothetical protein SAMN05216207_10658 [Pseudonocardia ammonioxydans]